MGTRREFLKQSALAGIGAVLSGGTAAPALGASQPAGAGQRGQGKMARVVRIAAAQVRDHVEGNTPQEMKAYLRREAERFVRAAAEKNADIVCFCETHATYRIKAPLSDRDVWEEATTGPTAQWAGQLARAHNINLIMPMAAYHDGAFRNCAVFFNRQGEVVGVYVKVHLTYREREGGRVPGDSFPVFEMDFGKVGCVICHDLSFPESVRCLALAGAEIVFWPTHWSGWGDELNYAVIRSRAIDNAVYLVVVGLAPPPGTYWRPGRNIARSGVIDPYGNFISNAGFDEGVSIAEVDLSKPARIAPSFSYGPDDDFRAWMLADRVPEAYGIIVDPARRPPPPVKG